MMMDRNGINIEEHFSLVEAIEASATSLCERAVSGPCGDTVQSRKVTHRPYPIPSHHHSSGVLYCHGPPPPPPRAPVPCLSGPTPFISSPSPHHHHPEGPLLPPEAEAPPNLAPPRVPVPCLSGPTRTEPCSLQRVSVRKTH